MGRNKDRDSFDELQKQKKRKKKREERRYTENPAKSSPQTGYRRKRKEKKTGRKFGKFLVFVQTVLTFLFMWTLLRLDILPLKILLPIIIVLLLFLWFVRFTQKRHKRRAIPGKLISIFMIIILGAGTYYLGIVNGAFNKVTDGDSHKIDLIAVSVLASDPAETLADAADYTFAVQYEFGKDDIEAAINMIEEELDSKIDVVEYEDVHGQAMALLNGDVDAIIYNEAYTDMLEDESENFTTDTKIIYKHEIKTKLEDSETSVIDVTQDTFQVYLSGIDVFGSIQQTSRSDVNIIVTVNPKTRQILLTTTPRDAYVTLPGVSDGQKDKLTHAGLYGVDVSMAALENVYETTIPFYVRVNFTSIIQIVDKLGGVDVYSEYEFTTRDGYKVKKGINHFDGEEALSFCRERKNVPGGDNQRGKNQQAVIVAMIKKMLSPKMLIAATGILESVSENVDTNVSRNQIQSLIKMQLREGGGWNICSVAAEGTGTKGYTYSMPSKQLYVTQLNHESVLEIMELMILVKNGEILENSELVK